MVRSIKNPKKAKRKATKGDGSSSSSGPSMPAKVWQPGVDKLEEGEELHCDPSAYNSLHAFHIGWPCLSDLGHWNNLEEGEASKKDGGHRRTTAESPTIEPQRHQPKIFFPNWDIIFMLSSAFSLIVDPLICYIPVIVKNDPCFFWDKTLMWTFLALRSFTDLFYYMDIVVFLKRFRTKLAKSSAKAFSTKTNDDHLVTTVRNFIHKKPVRFLAILLRIWVALPFQQLYGSMWYFWAVDREIRC